MKKLKVIKSLISLGSYQEQLDRILNLPKAHNSSYVCIANVHMTIEVYQDKSFAQIVNNAELATPDGMPLAKAIKFIYGIAQDRVAGMDLTADIMRECEKNGESIFL
jgi:N-acetylglucosaminyldiphosphoundecaprenol N-acetyl-beta-D-mannosaminyltransferase